ncbi:hypothetical protein LTR84_004333 [Exophiala bonariae]|uniref:N-acetyltransferase domain-containing protein n=1 Tax=Exophiala bonariae TaxID=1690606 RepID=A0AAV9N6M2_9EURO|nr:hypothetical protein LTR84_004333 [Exophiala bonariae]
MESATLTSENISTSSVNNGQNATSGQQTPYIPPSTTISTSADYRYRLADIYARASVQDPLIIMFEQDKDPSVMSVTAALVRKACEGRIERKVNLGSLIVEAANFAAVACWEPPSATPSLLTTEELEVIAQQRPTFAQFTRDIQSARIEILGPETKYWSLSLMARDPDRKDRGAVRAVIEPFVARAKEEGVPLWLTAANTRARDVYQYFGFRVVRYIESFPQGQKQGEGGGVPSWVMVCNWPPA